MIISRRSFVSNGEVRASDFGMYVRPYDESGKRLKRVKSADTESMEGVLGGKYEGQTVKLSRLAVDPSAPSEFLELASELGLPIDGVDPQTS